MEVCTAIFSPEQIAAGVEAIAIMNAIPDTADGMFIAKIISTALFELYIHIHYNVNIMEIPFSDANKSLLQ